MTTSAQRAGYSFEKTIKKSFDHAYPDGYAYKIIDTHSITGLLTKLKGQHVQWNNFLIPKVPADYICIVGGHTYFIELKSTSNKTSFPLGNIKDHQLKSAEEITMAGGIYYFIIQRHEARNFKAWAIEYPIFSTIVGDLGGKKSIKWDIFDDHTHVIKLPRIKGSIYDLSGMFNR